MVNLFNKCLQYCNLIDLEYFGPSFTQSNCRTTHDLILERLDRVICNPS